jgi:hypothetical protein
MIWGLGCRRWRGGHVTADTPPPLLHPEMAIYYRNRVGEIYYALKAEPKNQQMVVTEALRTLIDLHPNT